DSAAPLAGSSPTPRRSATHRYKKEGRLAAALKDCPGRSEGITHARHHRALGAGAQAVLEVRDVEPVAQVATLQPEAERAAGRRPGQARGDQRVAGHAAQYRGLADFQTVARAHRLAVLVG